MNTETDFATILLSWQQELSALYDEREVAAMFRIALEDLLELGKHDQLSQWNSVQGRQTITLLEAVLKRLLNGEPLQHIIGFTYFDDLKIRVSPEVLIPRPETEELVYEVVNALPQNFSGTIIDWCTGSGCIALALKKHFPAATVYGYDLSVYALDVARLNAAELNLDVKFEQKNALEQDFFAFEAGVIISNPPYIPQQEMPAMHKNVTNFEPAMALFVPDDSPLLFYKAITEIAAKQLKPGGHLFFELHENFAIETLEMVNATGKFSHAAIKNDLQGKSRMLIAKR